MQAVERYFISNVCAVQKDLKDIESKLGQRFTVQHDAHVRKAYLELARVFRRELAIDDATWNEALRRVTNEGVPSADLP